MYKLLPLINYSMGSCYTKIILIPSNYAKITYHSKRKTSMQLFSISCDYLKFQIVDTSMLFCKDKYDITEHV